MSIYIRTPQKMELHICSSRSGNFGLQLNEEGVSPPLLELRSNKGGDDGVVGMHQSLVELVGVLVVPEDCLDHPSPNSRFN